MSILAREVYLDALFGHSWMYQISDAKPITPSTLRAEFDAGVTAICSWFDQIMKTRITKPSKDQKDPFQWSLLHLEHLLLVSMVHHPAKLVVQNLMQSIGAQSFFNPSKTWDAWALTRAGQLAWMILGSVSLPGVTDSDTDSYQQWWTSYQKMIPGAGVEYSPHATTTTTSTTSASKRLKLDGKDNKEAQQQQNVSVLQEYVEVFLAMLNPMAAHALFDGDLLVDHDSHHEFKSWTRQGPFSFFFFAFLIVRPLLTSFFLSFSLSLSHSLGVCLSQEKWIG